VIVAILISVGLVAAAFDEEPTQSSTPTSASSSPVKVGEMKAATVAPGEKTTLIVPVLVADGHRIQANPASNEFLVPLQLEMEDIAGLQFGPPVYPEGEPYVLEGADEILMTYIGEVEVVLPVSATGAAAPGDRTVMGELRYQACNSRMCLFPASLPVAIQIFVSESEAPDRLETGQ
jgi:hypothetical protein